MRRNNTVFLYGTIASYEERQVPVDRKTVAILDLKISTDRSEITDRHRVVVRGHQADELKHFLAVGEELPDVMVLGWLRSGAETVVMAERVTVIAPREVRQAAIRSIRQAKPRDE